MQHSRISYAAIEQLIMNLSHFDTLEELNFLKVKLEICKNRQIDLADMQDDVDELQMFADNLLRQSNDSNKSVQIESLKNMLFMLCQSIQEKISKSNLSIVSSNANVSDQLNSFSISSDASEPKLSPSPFLSPVVAVQASSSSQGNRSPSPVSAFASEDGSDLGLADLFENASEDRMSPSVYSPDVMSAHAKAAVPDAYYYLKVNTSASPCSYDSATPASWRNPSVSSNESSTPVSKNDVVDVAAHVLKVIDSYIAKLNTNTYGRKRAVELKTLVYQAVSTVALSEVIMEFLCDGKTQVDQSAWSFFSSLSRSSGTHEDSLRGMLMDNFVYGKPQLTRNKRAEVILSSLKNKSFKDNFELSFSNPTMPVFSKSEKSDYLKIVGTRAIY
ncbi:MAG: hypothetical protein P4M12_03315 [Gammaproteobacteria bacterium]|nr:hypothetical protein [Gammaproteobacteria bacterium]